MSQLVPAWLRPCLMVNPVRHYAWGACGRAALIPQLLGIPAEPGRPYAELWIGAHPSAPSDLETSVGPVPLDHAVVQAPEPLLGPRVRRRFSGAFPFLLKVLDAARSLSIQAHPNRRQAERLRRRDPDHHPDPNHKPELAVALDGVRALAGFRRWREIERALGRVPELTAFLGGAVTAATPAVLSPMDSAQTRQRLRLLVATLLDRVARCPDRFGAAIEATAARFQASAADLDGNERLLLELSRDYPGSDPGLAFALLLNVVHLDSGQGLFIDAGVPHAYLGGRLVECMAASDNVVRVGLTEKHKDAAALLEIVECADGPATVLESDPKQTTTVYSTPAREFELTRYRLRPGDTLGRRHPDGPVVILVLNGTTRLVWPDRHAQENLAVPGGRSVLIPAATPSFQLTAHTDALVFRVEVPS